MAADGLAPGALGRAPAAAAAALAGFGCMAAELAAVRLLAPHFGDSAYVWTNVIGVILAAMAAGAFVGGRLATRSDPRRAAARMALVAGPWIAASPWASGALGGWLLPADLPLDAAMPAMVRGSLVATLLLFAPPMAAIGALSPLLVTAVVRGGGAVGAASGGMAAAGTFGSLLGTFLATHWLVPTFGCRAAMAIAGGALAVAGLLLIAGRKGAASLASLALCAVAVAAPRGPLRDALPGERLVAEVESRMQYLQVVRSEGEPGRTRLCINEGLDSFHSLAIDGSCFSGGAYYDWHAIAPLLAGGGERPAGLRVVSIGDAAGTLRRVYAAVHPDATVDAVDVDAATMALGDAHFPGPKSEGGRFVLDGRVFLARSSATWDVIHVDAYAHQVYVPAHLASREFFDAARARLRPGGVVVCNVGALRRDDPVLARVGASMAAVFGNARAMLVPNSRNALLVARLGEPPNERDLAGFQFGGERFASEADAEAWRGIVTTVANAAWFACAAGEPWAPLDDDRPELDRLLAASYLESRDAGVMVAIAGKAEPVAAELAAYNARQRLAWPDVLTAVAASSSATSYLRELAGDARWSLRELRAAAAEYGEALRLAEDAQAKERLAGKLQSVVEEAKPVARAEELATRNGWLQPVAMLLALCVVLALMRAGA